MNLKLIYILIFLSLTQYITSQECTSFKKMEENSIITELKSNPSLYLTNPNECLEILIKGGFFNSSEEYINLLIKNKIKFKHSLNTIITEYNLFLNQLVSKFKFKETEFQKVSPAIKWAQNKDYIVLEIKFSHRHDSPGNIIILIIQDVLRLRKKNLKLLMGILLNSKLFVFREMSLLSLNFRSCQRMSQYRLGLIGVLPLL